MTTIVIPSLSRADILCERTLPLLLELYEIDPTTILFRRGKIHIIT